MMQMYTQRMASDPFSESTINSIQNLTQTQTLHVNKATTDFTANANLNCEKVIKRNGAFTLPDSESDKVSDSDKTTVCTYGVHIRIGSRIRIGSISVNTPLYLRTASRGPLASGSVTAAPSSPSLQGYYPVIDSASSPRSAAAVRTDRHPAVPQPYWLVCSPAGPAACSLWSGYWIS